MDGTVTNDKHILVAQTPLAEARPIRMGVATPAPEMPDGMQFGTLLGVLHRWSRMIGVVTAVGLICVCILAWSLPVRYTAKAQIIVETPRGLLLDPRRAGQNPNADPATMFTEVTALSSYDVLSGVRARLAGDAEGRVFGNTSGGRA